MEFLSNLTLEIFNQPFLLEKRIELLIAIKKQVQLAKQQKKYQ
jgi:molybdate transport system regulatory protein